MIKYFKLIFQLVTISFLILVSVNCSKFNTIDDSNPKPENQAVDVPPSENPPVDNSPPPPETVFTEVTLAWDYPKERTTPTTSIESDLSGYRISRGTSSGVYDFDYPLIDPSLRTFQLTDLKLNTTYYIAIRAIGKLAEESGYSNEVQFNKPALMVNQETPSPLSDKVSGNIIDESKVQNLMLVETK